MGADWHGGAVPDTSVNLGGFSMPLKQKMVCAGSAGAAANPLDSRSTVEVTFGQDLPAFDWTSPTMQVADWSPPEPRLHLVHHSFYANVATRTMRHPLGWHRDIAKFDVLGNGGHMVLGGLQDIPTWRCWTKKANLIDQTLIWELYRMEQEGLAFEYGATDPRKLANELENEPVEDWTMAAPSIGFRQSLVDVMYPIARAAWGPERTMLIKGTSFGALDSLISEWDLTNTSHFGGGNSFLCNHNFDGQTHRFGKAGGEILWYDNYADCEWHVNVLKEKITTGGFKGGGLTEFGIANWHEASLRGRMWGKMETACYHAGLFNCGWDMTGDHYSAAYLYTDVPGAVGRLVQARDPLLRPFCGKAERSF
jgi:hypothetical protein